VTKQTKWASRPLSEDDVRAGTTGHNVRYVLIFGLTGTIVAFVGLAIYLGFDQLQHRISDTFARGPGTILQSLLPYTAVVLVAVVGAVLLLGLWNMVAGRSENTSQMGMRIRVVGQFVVVCAIMAIFYLAAS
jgi:hypothetical protein